MRLRLLNTAKNYYEIYYLLKLSVKCDLGVTQEAKISLDLNEIYIYD
jgi:hypothetical protein